MRIERLWPDTDFFLNLWALFPSSIHTHCNTHYKTHTFPICTCLEGNTRSGEPAYVDCSIVSPSSQQSGHMTIGCPVSSASVIGPCYLSVHPAPESTKELFIESFMISYPHGNVYRTHALSEPMLAAHVTCRTHSDTVSRNVETGDTNGNGRDDVWH
jgi:hypothetical protein